jgi:hypothetical protein
MTVLGIDYDTRAVHCVLLDEDTNAARYVPVPFVDHRPPFRFDDARNVRAAVNEAIWKACRKGMRQPLDADGWDSIHLVGIEKPYAQGRGTAYTYGLITGAILSAIPRGIPVLDMPPNDRLFGWKALSVGRTNATKDEVRYWATRELRGLPADEPPSEFLDALDGTWPQDAFDAYCIARAARRLNAEAAAA